MKTTTYRFFHLCLLYIAAWSRCGCWSFQVELHGRPLVPKRQHSFTVLSSSSSTDSQLNEQYYKFPPPRLVVLIPAFNEQERIGSTLQLYQDFLIQWQNATSTSSSILLVDDGSTDDTCRVVDDFASPNKNDNPKEENYVPVQCIRMPENGGKGAALAYGVQFVVDKESNNHQDNDLSQPPPILTQDADGSGQLTYLPEMMQKLCDLIEDSNVDIDDNVHFWSTPAMVVGNRNYDFFSPRGITRWGFQTTVKLLMNDLRVQDSQCGYKLMTLPAAELLYKDLHLQGWSHDVEVLYRAKLSKVPIAEIPIDWEDKDGSKVVESGVAKVSLQMLLDVLRLRWNYSVTKSWRLFDD